VPSPEPRSRLSTEGAGPRQSTGGGSTVGTGPRKSTGGGGGAKTGGKKGRIKKTTVVHLPPMPGDNFELQMWLEDLTAELDEVDRRVQCRELHERGLEPNLPHLIAIFRHYCSPAAWSRRSKKVGPDCSPRHPPHFRPSFLDSNGIT